VSPPDLILASASPRRRELLVRIGLVLEVAPVDLDETPRAGESARPYAQRLAAEKCAAATDRRGGDDPPLLAADTVVVLEGEIFGKPADDADAARMLRQLSGRTHRVITAVALAWDGDEALAVSVSRVRFAVLGERDIAGYVATGEPFGKAGAYAIQSAAAAWIARIEGSYTGIMGLPLYETATLLRWAGVAGGV